MERVFSVRGKHVTLAIEETGEHMRIVIDGEPLDVEEATIGERYVTLRIGARLVRLPYARSGAHVHVACGGESYELVPAEEADDAERGEGAFVAEITSPMPGKVLAVKVAVGDIVEPDQPLLLLEAMKMEQTVRAPTRARVVEVRVQDGAMVGPGAVLMVLEEVGD